MDFLRGVFDGDGSCYGYWDPRWKSSFMFYISFSSGSLSFLEWLREKLRELTKINGHIKTGKRSWQLCYAKTESKILFKKMYYRKKLLFLKRKYEKLKKFIDFLSKIKIKKVILNYDKTKLETVNPKKIFREFL